MRNEKVVKVVTHLLLLLCGLHVQAQNFTNKGKEFWVAYGHNEMFTVRSSDGVNSQDMLLYLSAEQPAKVTVNIPGTTWSKEYLIPANAAIATDLMPKEGEADCRLLGEGLFRKNIHVVSDVPIVAYTHTYGDSSSGASLLLPVSVYGYTYFSANCEQKGPDDQAFCWFYVVASEDNTTVRITPTNETQGGWKRGVSYDVPLKRGEVYNVMGKMNGNSLNLAGSKIQSIPGADGKCHRIAVFSGSSRTQVNPGDPLGSGSDYMMTQVFPVNAWGRNYLTAITSSSDKAAVLHKTNRFRVFLSDITTKVYRNGTRLTGLQNNSFYEFDASTADFVTADKPIMVSQIITSSNGGGNNWNIMDPEMIYLSPIEQAIDKVVFYNNSNAHIDVNYLTLIIPENGVASLRIDGSNAFDTTYAHPNKSGYRVVVKQMPVTPMQHVVQSDSGFTAVTYGLGMHESYGYNIGCNVNNLVAIPQIKPTNSNATYDYVCSKTPFLFSVKTIYQATAITLHFSQVQHVTPATDFTITNPVASGTTIVNGVTYYIYDLPDQYEFSVGGDYQLPVSITSPSIDNCSQSEIITIPIPVHQGPAADFTAVYGCVSEDAHFSFVPVSTDADFLKWDFGDNTTNTTDLNPVKKYAQGGTYNVKVQVKRNWDGCLGDTVKVISIQSLPHVDFKLPTAICMPGGKAIFTNATTNGDGGAGSFSSKWQFGDGAISTETNPQHTYSSSNTYTVKLIATANGCADSISKPLPVTAFIDKPIASFTLSDTAFCVQQQAGFVNTSTYNTSIPVSWNWSFGNGQTATTQTPVTQYLTAGSYSVQLTVDNGGCISSTASVPLRVYKAPAVDAGPDAIIATGDVHQLRGTVTGDVTSIMWSPDTYLSANNILNPLATPSVTQTFYLTVTGKAGCASTDSVVIKVFNDIRVPNVFTPNGDGINDRWDIKGLADYYAAVIEIYNRWGQPVLRISGGYSKPWDGTSAGGSPLPGGTYYYVIQPNANGLGKITGAVTIIR